VAQCLQRQLGRQRPGIPYLQAIIKDAHLHIAGVAIFAVAEGISKKWSGSTYGTQIKGLPIFPPDKPTHRTLHSIKVILDNTALSDDPMYPPVTLYRLLPAIACNTAKILIGWPGVTSPVAPSCMWSGNPGRSGKCGVLSQRLISWLSASA
jgi:hypothetical protein